MRPEFVRCIAHTHADKIGLSLCGRTIGTKDLNNDLRISEFVFLNIDHWLYTKMSEGRLLGCSDCLDVIREALAP